MYTRIGTADLNKEAFSEHLLHKARGLLYCVQRLITVGVPGRTSQYENWPFYVTVAIDQHEPQRVVDLNTILAQIKAHSSAFQTQYV